MLGPDGPDRPDRLDRGHGARVLRAAGIAAAKGWLLPGERFTAVVASASLAAAVLTAGVRAERRQAGPLRRAGARIMAGAALSALCAVTSLIVIAFFIAGVLAWGTPASVPPASEVLPLPAGMAVTSDTSHGCGAGSQTYCIRQILARAPAGTPGPLAARRIAGQLTGARGWHLTGGAGNWDGCRTEGWLLDRHQACVTITATPGSTDITLETTDSW